MESRIPTHGGKTRDSRTDSRAPVFWLPITLPLLLSEALKFIGRPHKSSVCVLSASPKAEEDGFLRIVGRWGFGSDGMQGGLCWGLACLCGWSVTLWAPACLGSVNRLRELCVCGVCGAAYKSDPFVQIGFSHSTVKGKNVSVQWWF